MFPPHSVPPERGNFNHKPSKLLQGTNTKSPSTVSKGSSLPKHTPPLCSKPWPLKSTYRLESIPGEDEFVLAADAIPLNSGSNLLQHIQPKRDKRGKNLFEVKEFTSPGKQPRQGRTDRQPPAEGCVPVSVQGLIAEANAGVDQRGATVNGQEILVGIEAGPSAGGVTKHGVTAPVAVATAMHFQPEKLP